MKRPAFCLRCATLVAESTVREALRQRLWLLLVGMAVALASGALALRAFDFGSSESRFLMDAGFGVQWVFGAILAVVATTQLFYSELERRTALMVLARPVRRIEFIVGKLGGVLLLLLGFCGLMTGLLVTLLWWHGAGLPDPGQGAMLRGRGAFFGDVAWSGLVLWLRTGVLAAMTMFVASYARSGLFTVMTGFVLLVICQLQHLARECLWLMESPWAKGLVHLIQLLIPDLELLNLSDRVVAGEALPGGVVGCTIAYGLAYVGVFGMLAAYCFQRREL